MDIVALKSLLSEAMPVLNFNLDAAYREYMDGKIPHGAYSYVLARHANACAVLDKDDIDVEAAFQVCARLTLDLRCGCTDLKQTALLEKWLDLFRVSGFTETHPIFDFPTRPVVEAA